MPKTALKKEKWTLTFDPGLKEMVTKEARRNGMYPVALLEQMVREKFNPFGHPGVGDAAAYVRALRRRSRGKTDAAFLRDIREWRKSNS